MIELIVLRTLNYVWGHLGNVLIDFLVGSDFFIILKWWCIGKFLDYIWKQITD